MLVLTRREAEEVSMNGRQIRVRVLNVRGGRVRLAIDAPKDVPIYRGEVWDRIKQEDVGDDLATRF